MTESSTLSVIKHLPSESTRILKLSKKPTRLEYEDVIKITGLGIIILGTIGLAFILIRALLEGKFA